MNDKEKGDGILAYPLYSILMTTAFAGSVMLSASLFGAA